MSPPPFADHLPSLRRYARALTGEAWAADDLVQDTLERACNKWRLWLAGSDLRAWLFTLMHNLHMNQLRRLRRQPAADAWAAADELDALPARAVPMEQALDLQRCLLRLPDGQRATLLLVTLEDMRYEDVARITGVPVGTVMSRLSRARSRLRELMEGGAPDAAHQPAPAAAPPLRRLK